METINEGAGRVRPSAGVLAGRFVATLAGLIAVASLISTGTASAQTPPSQWPHRCVTDKTDSFLPALGNSLIYKSQNFRATACEYRSGMYMQAGARWKILNIDKQGGPVYLEGESIVYYQVWDCTTGNIVRNFAMKYGTAPNHPRRGTAESKTFIVTPSHTYRVRTTGWVHYLYAGGNWEFSLYPSEVTGMPHVGKWNAYSTCL